MIFAPGAKRAAIFAYYDPDGVVDDYIPVLINGVREHCARVICMVNGTVNEAGMEKLSACSDAVIGRANEGLDVTAYKEGYQHLRDEGLLSDIDEVLFFNQTVFGPIYPFAELFEAMDARDVDFWGMTRHRGMDRDPWGTIPYGYMPPHIQSYFFAVRRSMFDTADFNRYWDELPPITGYFEAVGIHEVCFTKKFADLGYSWDVYVHSEGLERYNDYPLMGIPMQVLRRLRCPVVKRKSFLTDRITMNSVPHGGAATDLYYFLRDETDYDTALIAQNLTRTATVAEYTDAMGLFCDMHAKPAAAHSHTVCFWLADERLAYVVQQLAQKAEADRYVVFCKNEAVMEAMAQVKADVDCRLNRKKPMACFADYLPEVSTEFVTYLPVITESIIDGLFDLNLTLNLLECLADPRPLMAAMEADPGLGLISAAPVTHLAYLSQAAMWGKQQQPLQVLLEKAGVPVLLSEKRTPLRLFGGGFFARTAAVADMAAINWEEPDAQPLLYQKNEPACEYIPALCCQAKGLLCGFAMPAQAAYRQLLNQQAQLDAITSRISTPDKRRIDEILFRLEGIMDFYYERRYMMTLEQAFQAELSFKQKLWIILQILLKPATFDKLHRLLHGGRPSPEPEYPPDLLD